MAKTDKRNTKKERPNKRRKVEVDISNYLQIQMQPISWSQRPIIMEKF
jgi:hypothetical protein